MDYVYVPKVFYDDITFQVTKAVQRLQRMMYTQQASEKY